MGEEVNHSRALARSAGLVSALTALSRLLGLVREMVFAALLGAGLHADAFQIGFRIPNLLRDLFAEGALSAAFVPTYARVFARDGRAAAHRLSSRLLTLLGVGLGGLVLLGMLLAEPIVGKLAPGFDPIPGKTEAAVFLTRVMFPFLPLVSFAAVAMGMLNAQGRYGPPALAPSMFNVMTVLWGGVLWAMGFGPAEVAIGWALGTLLGGAAQFLIQVPPLWKDGWRLRPEWAPRDPGIRHIAGLMAPATLGLAAVQVNIFVSTSYASEQPGAVAWINYAFRILYLPIGVFGVALGTIAGARLARRAAEADLEGVRETLRQALRMLAFLTVPATLGLLLLRVPIVRLLYERGRFGPEDTQETAAALLFYSVGLVAYTGVKVLAPAFYALGSPRVPVLASALAVATNLVAIAVLFPRMGFAAVALGTSLGSLGNAAVLALVFERQVGGLRRHGLGRAVVQMGLAGLAMLPVAWASLVGLETALGTRGLGAQLATGLLPVASGALAYIAVARLMGIEEARAIVGLVRGPRARH